MLALKLSLEEPPHFNLSQKLSERFLNPSDSSSLQSLELGPDDSEVAGDDQPHSLDDPKSDWGLTEVPSPPSRKLSHNVPSTQFILLTLSDSLSSFK